MLALSIRQPYLELILRGIKKAELRRRTTHVVGQRFYLYAAKGNGKRPTRETIWSRDLAVATPPPWMIELAAQIELIPPDESLVTGMIVGTALIDHVEKPTSADDLYRWVLSDVKRLDKPRKPQRQPQPTWFRPW
jgi:hypothetical protein